MNKEIYTILADLQRLYRKGKPPIADSDKQIYLSIRSSELRILLAEESEKSSKKIERLTNVLIALTIAIVILTAILVFSELIPKNEKLNQGPDFKAQTNDEKK